jgi:hypothetical protein
MQSAIPIKTGTYLFAADRESPAYVGAVRQALSISSNYFSEPFSFGASG